MKTVKQQNGTAVFDGVVKKYCKIVIEIDGSNDFITRDSLKEQFGLLADSFWLFLKEQDDLTKQLNKFGDSTDLGFNTTDLKKGWD